MNDREVTVHIERLLLDGFDLPPHARGVFQAALQAELARLITAGGLAEGLLSGGAYAGLPPVSVDIHAGMAPQALGVRAAQAVFAGLGNAPG